MTLYWGPKTFIFHGFGVQRYYVTMRFSVLLTGCNNILLKQIYTTLKQKATSFKTQNHFLLFLLDRSNKHNLYIRTYITLHYITLHYITLHYITLHYITLHYIHTHIHTSIITNIHTLPRPPFVPSQFNIDKTIGHTEVISGDWTKPQQNKTHNCLSWHLFCVCSLEIFRSNAKKRNSRLGKSFSLDKGHGAEGLWWMFCECLWPVGNLLQSCD